LCHAAPFEVSGIVAVASDHRSNDKRPTPARYSPLVLVAVAAALGICGDRVLTVSGAAWWAAAAALLAMWGACYAADWPRAGSLVLLVAIAAGAAAWHHARWSTFRHDDIGNWATEDRQPVCLGGTLLDQPRLVAVGGDDPLSVLPAYEQTLARLAVDSVRDGTAWQPASGRTRLRVTGALLNAQPGDRVVVFGQLSKPRGRRNPGQFDFRGLLRSRRIRAVVSTEHADCVRVERRPGGWKPQVYLARFRSRAERVLWEALAHERAGLAAALLLGSREHLDDDTEEAFVKTGTMHLLAISGLHLGILAGFLWFWLNLVGVPRRPAALTVALLVAAYALVIESRPPVMRAAILVGVACGAIAIDRPLRTANTLAAALIVVLLVNPAELFHTGLQLSFLSAGALLWFGVRWVRAKGRDDPLQRLLYAERPLAWRAASYLVTTLWSGVLITGLIWCVTLPLLMAQFHLFSPVAFFLNVVLIPLVAVVLFCGFGVLVSGLLFPIVLSPFAWGCDRGIRLIDVLVDGAASIEWGHLYVPGPAAWWLAGYYGGLAALVVFPALRRAGSWCLAATALWIGMGLAAPLFRAAPDHVECVFLDVGHGLASVIHLPGGKTLVYDAGLLGNPRHGGQNIADYLWSRGVRRIDAIMLSHADTDHFNAVPFVTDRFAVGGVLVAPSFADLGQRSVRAVCEHLARNEVPIRFCWKGDRIALGGDTELRVLHPSAEGTGGSDNADSLVVLLTHRRCRLLLTGDLQEPGVTQFVTDAIVPVDALLLPHHGSPASNPPELLRRARPETAIVSQRKSRGGPGEPDAYRKRGRRVYSTAEGGAVGVVLDGNVTRARYLLAESE
jgi:competence protein ComEC